MTDSNGLYYMRARYYDPKIKRFINRDVIRGNVLDWQTFNRYAYVNGNPVSFIDPLGLEKGKFGGDKSNKEKGQVDDFAKEPFVPDEYWGRKAPDYNTPGLKYDHYREYNGKIERSTVIYDDAGRQKYRVDHDNHSMPDDHSTPHLHERKFGTGYSDKGKEYDYHFWDE